MNFFAAAFNLKIEHSVLIIDH